MMGVDKNNDDGKFPMVHSMLVDNKYMVIGTHVDDSLYEKITRGQYVDFGKLIPRDRLANEEDNRLELIFKNGKAYWIPAHESVAINSLAQWEQAFRVFSNIYTKEHPYRSSEYRVQSCHSHHVNVIYLEQYLSI